MNQGNPFSARFFLLKNNLNILNLCLTAAYLSFNAQHSGKGLIPFLFLLNTSWFLISLMGYYFKTQPGERIFVNKRRKWLITQGTIFFTIYLLVSLKIITSDLFVFSNAMLNVLICIAGLINDLLSDFQNKKLRGVKISNDISGQTSQYFNNSFSFLDEGFSEDNVRKENVIGRKRAKMSLDVSAQTERSSKPTLEEAEYNFLKINIGDTLAYSSSSFSYGFNYLDTLFVRELKNRIIKRGLDIFISLFVIIFILSWLILLIGILIKLESKGPIFFKQLRSGINNKAFWCIKFRSMNVNSECDEVQATRGDSRITRVGAFLRKTSLDEFPQFLNVLIGDMSIVSPHPHRLMHTEIYGVK